MESNNWGSSGTQITENDRLLAILSHALTLVAGFLAPLIIYLLKKDESPYITEHAKESLNFQITLTIFYVIGFVTLIFLIGLIILPVIGILHLVLVVVATVKAADNKFYRYPLNIRLIR
jgi:uncharacterized Tic20 family protein